MQSEKYKMKPGKRETKNAECKMKIGTMGKAK
jgi:hypothetical protein